MMLRFGLLLLFLSMMVYKPVHSYLAMSTLSIKKFGRKGIVSPAAIQIAPTINSSVSPLPPKSAPVTKPAAASVAATIPKPRQPAAALPPTKQPSKFLQRFYAMMEEESVGSLLPKEDLVAMANEIRFNQVIMRKAYTRFEVVWKHFQTLVYEEDRNLQSILGDEISRKVLDIAGKLDFYEKKTVRSFIRTPAFTGIFGGIVYEMLLEGLQRMDLLGRTVNKLPVVGPLRQRIGRTLRSTVDRTVGLRFKKAMLKNLDKDSMSGLADFMVAQRDNKGIEGVNRNIIEGILTRPLKTFFPEGKEADEKLKKAIWSIVTDTPTSEFVPIINFLYENLGAKRLSDIVALSFDPDLADQCTSFEKDGSKTVFSSTVKGTTVNVIIKL